MSQKIGADLNEQNKASTFQPRFAQYCPSYSAQPIDRIHGITARTGVYNPTNCLREQGMT